MKAELVFLNPNVDSERVNRKLISVSYTDDVGMAAEVQITASFWDSSTGEYDEDVVSALYHDEEFELWSGGSCFGLFKIEDQDKEYTSDSGPVLNVAAFNGLRRLMKHEQSRVYQGFVNDADWLPDLFEDHGLKVDVDSSELRRFKGDRFKEVGQTDFEFISLICQANGLGMPWLHYDPETGDETVVMRLIDAIRNRGSESFKFRALAQDGQADFQFFRTYWDTGDIPTAVEVIGWDPKAKEGKGSAYRVTVQVTPKGPKALAREYVDISKKEQKKVAPGRSGEDSQGILVHLLGDEREVTDTSVTYKVDTGRTRTVKAPKGARVFTDRNGQKRFIKVELKNGKVEVKRGRVGRLKVIRRIRARRQYRQILHTQFVEGVKDAEEYAKAWLQVRMEAYYIAEATLKPNLPGSQFIRVTQAHRVVGTSVDDEGWYLTTAVTHSWDGDGHLVSWSAQRLLLDVIQPVSGRAIA